MEPITIKVSSSDYFRRVTFNRMTGHTPEFIRKEELWILLQSAQNEPQAAKEEIERLKKRLNQAGE